jgi:hypothetical protein
MLIDTDRLQASLQRLLGEERAQGYGDSDGEARIWTDKLTAIERKRSGFQDMAAEGLITFDELGVKLAELEANRAGAQRELEAIYHRRERLERLEKDTDEVMRTYAGALPGNLRTPRSGMRSTACCDCGSPRILTGPCSPQGLWARLTRCTP